VPEAAMVQSAEIDMEIDIIESFRVELQTVEKAGLETLATTF
jgi:hypothetical protein